MLSPEKGVGGGVVGGARLNTYKLEIDEFFRLVSVLGSQTKCSWPPGPRVYRTRISISAGGGGITDRSIDGSIDPQADLTNNQWQLLPKGNY